MLQNIQRDSLNLGQQNTSKINIVRKIVGYRRGIQNALSIYIVWKKYWECVI